MHVRFIPPNICPFLVLLLKVDQKWGHTGCEVKVSTQNLLP
jgi:hypothetical protein